MCHSWSQVAGGRKGRMFRSLQSEVPKKAMVALNVFGSLVPSQPASFFFTPFLVSFYSPAGIAEDCWGITLRHRKPTLSPAGWGGPRSIQIGLVEQTRVLWNRLACTRRGFGAPPKEYMTHFDPSWHTTDDIVRQVIIPLSHCQT